MSVAAIVLAAGESRRMGRPKAYLPFRNGTFLSCLAQTLSLRCGPVVAVFGADGEKLASQTPGGLTAVVNPRYQQGMLTSLQAGIQVLAGVSYNRLLFTLVDHPAVLPETIDLILNGTGPIVIPRVGGRRGHPVVISRDIAFEMSGEPAASKVHDVIDRHAADIEYVNTDDRGVLDDIDDEALYRNLLAREAPATR